MKAARNSRKTVSRSVVTVLASSLLLGAGWPVLAQVRVVDSKPMTMIASRQQESSGNGSYSNGASGLYSQLEMLRQEVLQLRGLVEQQAFELKRLKQQRLDDYMDLDRRVSELSKQSTSSVTDPSSNTVASTVSAKQAKSGRSERQLYRGAIDALLKKQDIDSAAQQLSTYLVDFPQGVYAPNAKYWLGEIYLSKGELEASKDWFKQLLNDHSDHRKVPDAQFKLGKVLHKMGQKDDAQNMLKQVASGNSSAAPLARDYLKANF